MKRLIGLIYIFFLVSSAQAQGLKLEVLNGHSSGVMSVAVSPDGKFALTGSTDWTALLWDLETGRQLRRFGGEKSGTHEMHILSVAFSRDGKFVLTGSRDRSARLWNTATGNQLKIFKGHKESVVSAAISPENEFVLTASEDKTARLWNAKTGEQLFEISHPGKVNAVAFSPDGQFFLTGGEDKIARLYETHKPRQPIKLFFGHIGEIKAVAFSPDGKRVLTGGDRTARLWDFDTTREIKGFEMANLVLSVAFAPNGQFVVVGTDSGRSVHLIDPTTGRTFRRFEGKGFSVAATDKELLVANGEVWNGNIVTIHSIDELQGESSANRGVNKPSDQTRFLSGKSEGINKIAVSPDFNWIVLGAKNDTSGLWNLKSGQMTQWWKYRSESKFEEAKPVFRDIFYQTYQQNSTIVAGMEVKLPILNARAVAFAPDGSYFLYADNFDIKGEYVDSPKAQSVRSFGFRAHDLAVTSIAVAADGTFFVSGSEDKTARLWQGTSKPMMVFAGHEGPVSSVACSPDGKFIATASTDQTIRLWSAKTGALIKILRGFETYISEIKFSPDGKTLATASGTYTPNRDNVVRLWNIETGKEIRRYGHDIVRELSGPVAGFLSVAFSADGRFLSGGSYDGSSYLWETATGKEIRRFGTHSDTVSSVQFSSDQKYLITGSNDATTRIWSIATGEELCRLVVFRNGTWAVVDRFGRYDASNGGDIDGIQWVFGTETIALSQLKDIYYTPNLLPRLLGYNKEPLADVRPLSKFKLFPEILSSEFNKQSADLIVKLRNRGGGIGPVRVLVNGSLASEDARADELRRNPDRAEAVITINLRQSAGYNQNGENRIDVIANDFDPEIKKSFVSSARSTTVVEIGESQAELKKPTLYAIVGGVSDYNGTQLDLNFAARDAEAFANALNVSARRLFCPAEKPQCDDKVKVKLLTTDDPENLPTKPNFRRAFEEIAQNSKPEDILVVYLAGHGTSLNVGDAETYFYLTQESEIGSKDAVAKNPERSISNAEILDWLTQTQWRAEKRGIDAGNKVLILDTCAAGTFESALNKTKQRDLSADQIRALERLKDRSGLQILMGSAANQSAYEASQYGQGLLTYALLEGIKGAALEDERVETGRLFDYAVNRVPKMDISNGTSGLQSPRVFGSTSIPIGIIKNEDRAKIKFLESPLPVFARPFIFKKDENFDTLGLIGIFAKTLDEAATPGKRGSGSSQSAPLVYIDEDSFPGAYRVTGTYTEENGQISIEAVLRKDGKTTKELNKVVGKDEEEAAEKLRDEVLKSIGTLG